MMRHIVLLLFTLLSLSLWQKLHALSPSSERPCRRAAIERLALGGATLLSGIDTWPRLASAAATPDFSGLLSQIQQARKQLEPIPQLIQDEKWDSVRAILIEPPLADCWAKTSRPLLNKYAEALGDSGGDELAALEAREELVSHLRYLDMAVYNNVFNPISVEGKSGATKELIRSYYEDPINEYKASLAGLEELIRLSSEI